MIWELMLFTCVPGYQITELNLQDSNRCFSRVNGQNMWIIIITIIICLREQLSLLLPLNLAAKKQNSEWSIVHFRALISSLGFLGFPKIRRVNIVWIHPFCSFSYCIVCTLSRFAFFTLSPTPSQKRREEKGVSIQTARLCSSFYTYLFFILKN